jgi:hypothetical protein
MENRNLRRLSMNRNMLSVPVSMTFDVALSVALPGSALSKRHAHLWQQHQHQMGSKRLGKAIAIPIGIDRSASKAACWPTERAVDGAATRFEARTATAADDFATGEDRRLDPRFRPSNARHEPKWLLS